MIDTLEIIFLLWILQCHFQIRSLIFKIMSRKKLQHNSLNDKLGMKEFAGIFDAKLNLKIQYQFTRYSHSLMFVYPITRSALEDCFDEIQNGSGRGLRHEFIRLSTFTSCPDIPVSFTRLAQAGFFYTGDDGESDEVTCYQCQVTHRGWSENDDPHEIHRQLSPNCQHNNDSETNDVPVGQSQYPRSHDNHDTSNDVGDNVTSYEHIQVQDEITRPTAHVERLPCVEEIRHSYTARVVPCPQNFTEYPNRVQSFNDPQWVHQARRQSPEQLAEAGFFYAGEGDKTVCFHCGVRLHCWESDDDPFVEHARWSPRCAYLRRRKGVDFIKRIQRDNLSIETQNNNINRQGAPRSQIAHLISQIRTQEDITQNLEKRLLCKVCLDREMCIVFFPCGHLCSCEQCGLQLQSCPVCRQRIQTCVRVILS